MKYLFLISTLFFLASHALAFEAILSAKSAAVPSKAELQKILTDVKVIQSRELFLPKEKKIIASFSNANIADARILTFASIDIYQQMHTQLKRSKSNFRLEPNEIDLRKASDPQEDLQWGYSNKGTWQPTDIESRATNYIPGRPGIDMNLPKDFGVKNSGKKILVAVMDTGVDVNHPDLKNQIFRNNESECKALEKFKACVKETKKPDGKEMSATELTSQRSACEKIWYDPNNPEVDQDKNGYPLDCQGWSLLGGLSKVSGILGNPDYQDDEGHGTHVAGIIAAEINNNFGIRGVSNNVQILPIQVVGIAPSQPLKPQSVAAPGAPDMPNPTTGDKADVLEKRETVAGRKRPVGLAELVARGVIYAIHNKAQVINFSMGWPAASDSEFMRAVFAEAQKRGIIVVAAAGNDSTQALLQPCSYAGVICVGAHGPDGGLTHFSNFGTGVDIAAPGANILGAYPMNKRPIAFRAQRGFEFMSGTSQAAPYITGIVAELLAQNLEYDEIYARLILGAQPLQMPLAIQTSTPHELAEKKTDISALRSDQDRNFILSGRVDVANALSIAPQALIVPSGKDRAIIYWDRRASSFQFSFFLKNFWQAAPAGTRIDAVLAPSAKGSVRPRLTALTPSKTGAWEKGEVRKFTADISITDSANPADSRIPSDINLDVTVSIPGQEPRTFLARAEIIVPITEDSFPADASVIPFPALPKAASLQETTYLKLVDDQLDNQPGYNDFIFFHYKEDELELRLVSQDRSQPAKTSPYSLKGSALVTDLGNEEKILEQIRARVDIDNDGQSEYVVGLMEDNRFESKPTPSPITFVYLNKDFKLLEIQKYDSKQAQIPAQIDGSQVQWMFNEKRKVPAWVGMGKDPYKKRTARDIWENPKRTEDLEFRFYYVDEKNKLQAIEKHKAENGNEFRILSIFRPTLAQVEAGKVPLLLARDTGTKLKPSYIFEFALAEAIGGKITNFRVVNFFQQGIPYRSLLETRVDSVRSLDFTGEQYLGTYWFSSGRPGEQRLSVLRNDNFQFTDFNYGALRGRADAALFIRSVYASKKGVSAIVLTNSELQFHDSDGQSIYRSLERYTFFEDSLTSTNQYPLVVADRNLWGVQKLPAVYLTEVSAIAAIRSVRITVPHYENGKLIELTNPARLRFRSDSQCKPINKPIWAGAEDPLYLDFQCQTKLVRIPLIY